MADIAKMPATAEKPVPTQNENFENEGSPPSKDFRSNSVPGNSFHHDSEYDTASDLEGGDDEYEDDDDESLPDGEDDLESENGSVVFDVERQRGDGQEQADFAKKVDEDRSNPQYIPKKGTFYEHDDRTADEPNATEVKPEEGGEGEATKSATPTIAVGSKTMKKWQPASAVDRWSHDRYDEGEQAPKSRSELVSAYGYDIRNEDGPPRARRRRRYGRGPSKYVRNWEDESAYVKSTGTPQRKPRPEDFPALGERDQTQTRRIKKSRSFRDEKENHYDRQGDRSRGSGGASQRDGRIERKGSSKTFRPGRQTMEFKNQNRNRLGNDISNSRIPNSGRPNERDDGRHGNDDPRNQVETVSFTNTKIGNTPSQNDRHNGHESVQMNQMGGGHRDVKEKIINNNSTVMPSRQQQQQSQQMSQLAARLQIQSRNEPSHVGSVQMHSILTQNQQELQLQQQQQQQNSVDAGRTKRYSSLRQRSQNEMGIPQAQMEHSMQQIQQLHEHQQQHQAQPIAQQPPQPQQHVLLPDQHLIQANLMQIYHTQDNMQAQIQNVPMQGLPAGHQPKPQYQNVNVNVQPQYQAAPTAPPAYYASSNEYATTATAPASQPAPYAQQQTAAYIQPQAPAPAPQMAFNASAPAQPQQPPPQQIPTGINYVQAPPPAPGAAAPYQGYPNYQNYNRVGGTTYFVPQQQPAPRPVIVPQRRPTNAIPILAPPMDKSKPRSPGEEEASAAAKAAAANAPIGSAENIDHILDNMFVQRPPYQPPSRKSSSPATESVGTSTTSNTSNIAVPVAVAPATAEDQPSVTPATESNQPALSNETLEESRLEESVKNLSIAEEQPATLMPVEQQQQPQTQTTAAVPVADPIAITTPPQEAAVAAETQDDAAIAPSETG